MVQNEDRWVTVLDLLAQSMLLLENLLKTRIVILNIPD